MAKDVRWALAQLQDQQHKLAHGTLSQPPATWELFQRACGEYTALVRAAALLRDVLKDESEGDDE